MTTRTKKLINAADDIIPEMIEGLVGAHPDIVFQSGTTGRAVVAVDGPRPGKVAVVIGGGSGHEPAFGGYVGRGLADAAAIGNVFASPSPAFILDAAHAADEGAGILFLFGNYNGDLMNFDMAADMLRAEGVAVRSIAVNDDVASAPKERASERRGIAGDFFVFKVAGAAADRMMDLDAVERLAGHANAMTRSMGVALSACSLPQTGKLNFKLGSDEMEIGMGLHGEPGVRRGKVESADAVATTLVEAILGDLDLSAGDEVALLVNGLGATTYIELYLLHRKARLLLEGRGIRILRSWVGEYATSLEMAGASITLLKLDAELKPLLEHPCHTITLKVGESPVPLGAAPEADAARRSRRRATAAGAEHATLSVLKTEGDITPALFRQMMASVGRAIIAKRDWFGELDGVIGDGDHGVTMEIGWSAVAKALAAAPADETIEATCRRIATTFLDAVGASSGPLYATAFREAGGAVADRLNLDAGALAVFLAAAAQGVRARGHSEPGDKTMVDAWVPAAESAAKAAASGSSSLETLRAAAAGAEAGMNATAAIAARRGRAAKLGERSIGHVDPGAASTFVMIEAMADALAAALADEAQAAP